MGGQADAPGRRLIPRSPGRRGLWWQLLRGRWRRSMRIRVIATTMLLGLIVVAALGLFLLARIRDGLIDSRTASAMLEAERLTRTAQQACDAADVRNAETEELFVNELMPVLEGTGGAEARGVILQRALRSTEPSDLKGRFSGVLPSAIPTSLRTAVNAESRLQAQITALPEALDEEGRPALAVGSVINVPLSGPFELYFVFPLDREQQILDLVRSALLGGGVALVLLVGAVAAVVTRQVVTPVRQAARTAEELASGRLDRRMQVRGEDDMARLGRAFNGMAGNLERQIHQLEELSRVQRRFVSDVSHELRTPLTTIRMASEVIHESRSGLDPVLARSAELLQNQLDRFESLLTDLLEISRFDAGAAVLDIELADLREVVEQVVDALTPLAEHRGSSLVVQTPAGPCVGQFDPRRVERVVRNLVGNAIEHGEGRTVEVTVAGSADAVAVLVRDHGVGIDPDGLAMVFNRFWRADPARARSTGGTGLGLAIALEDARLHGGWLQAWGRQGVGAAFRLTLPRVVGGVLTGSPLPLGPPNAWPPTGADRGPSAVDLPAGLGTFGPTVGVSGAAGGSAGGVAPGSPGSPDVGAPLGPAELPESVGGGG